MNYSNAIRLIGMGFLVIGCDESLGPLSEGSYSTTADRVAEVITSDANLLSKNLRRLSHHNDILIVLKDSSAPTTDSAFIHEHSVGKSIVIGISVEWRRHDRRESIILPAVGVDARNAVDAVLAAFGVAPAIHLTLPIRHARLPEANLEDALRALLEHPNVDYLVGVQDRAWLVEPGNETSALRMAKSAAIPSSPPLGSNPVDAKHTFHNVPQVWDYTRGNGMHVGVMMGGFAYDAATSNYHPDGQYFPIQPGYVGVGGILTRGFSAHYWPCTADMQYAGHCMPYEDTRDPWGSWMTGMVGENDNSIGYLGIMPDGLTRSMKVFWNPAVTGGECEGAPGATSCYDEDAIIKAIDWAIRNDVGVLAIPFAGTFSLAVESALYTAFSTHDILPVAAVPPLDKSPGNAEPASWSFVVGVCSVDSVGQNRSGCQYSYDDVAAFGSGAVLTATCTGTTFCSAPWNYQNPTDDVLTSSSAAVVAGIAGLLRSYRPSETANQIRDRLLLTGTGTHKKVDALAALLWVAPPPPSASIIGPSQVRPNVQCMWSASVSGGTPPYSYSWYRNGGLVGTSSEYTASTGGSGSFSLQLQVTDGAGGTDTDFRTVQVSSSAPICRY